MALTKVTSGGMDGTFPDDSIVNADINSSAAVALSKLATDPSNASNLASGTVPTARLGSGTASSSTFLAGDQTYKAAGGGILVAVTEFTSTVAGTFSANTLNGGNNMTQGYPILDGVTHTPVSYTHLTLPTIYSV